jgi:hypothetical protein
MKLIMENWRRFQQDRRDTDTLAGAALADLESIDILYSSFKEILLNLKKLEKAIIYHENKKKKWFSSKRSDPKFSSKEIGTTLNNLMTAIREIESKRETSRFGSAHKMSQSSWDEMAEERRLFYFDPGFATTNDKEDHAQQKLIALEWRKFLVGLQSGLKSFFVEDIGEYMALFQFEEEVTKDPSELISYMAERLFAWPKTYEKEKFNLPVGIVFTTWGPTAIYTSPVESFGNMLKILKELREPRVEFVRNHNLFVEYMEKYSGEGGPHIEPLSIGTEAYKKFAMASGHRFEADIYMDTFAIMGSHLISAKSHIRRWIEYVYLFPYDVDPQLACPNKIMYLANLSVSYYQNPVVYDSVQTIIYESETAESTEPSQEVRSKTPGERWREYEAERNKAEKKAAILRKAKSSVYKRCAEDRVFGRDAWKKTKDEMEQLDKESELYGLYSRFMK